VVGTFRTPVTFINKQVVPPEKPVFIFDSLFKYWPMILGAFGLVVGISLTYFLTKRFRGEDKK
jgi:hypothetical protein